MSDPDPPCYSPAAIAYLGGDMPGKQPQCSHSWYNEAVRLQATLIRYGRFKKQLLENNNYLDGERHVFQLLQDLFTAFQVDTHVDEVQEVGDVEPAVSKESSRATPRLAR